MAECVYGDPEAFSVEGADKDKGAFVRRCCSAAPIRPGSAVHDTVEAFGPVST
jgi:oxepin-CoA hydrolase/3-oxo-5,6-dehydrosuberyl-CoA semialdehyde dehydrogenase